MFTFLSGLFLSLTRVARVTVTRPYSRFKASKVFKAGLGVYTDAYVVFAWPQSEKPILIGSKLEHFASNVDSYAGSV